MGVTLKGVEIDCVKMLAKCFEEGKPRWSGTDGWEAIGLTEANYYQVLSLMESIGAIGNVQATSGSLFHYFTITPQAVQIARQIEDQEKKRLEGKDIVEHVKVTLRKHPITGWAAVVLIALVALVTALNQLVSLFKNLGWL